MFLTVSFLQGDIPLIHACWNGSVEVMHILLAAGACVNNRGCRVRSCMTDGAVMS